MLNVCLFNKRILFILYLLNNIFHYILLTLYVNCTNISFTFIIINSQRAFRECKAATMFLFYHLYPPITIHNAARRIVGVCGCKVFGSMKMIKYLIWGTPGHALIDSTCAVAPRGIVLHPPVDEAGERVKLNKHLHLDINIMITSLRVMSLISRIKTCTIVNISNKHNQIRSDAFCLGSAVSEYLCRGNLNSAS